MLLPSLEHPLRCLVLGGSGYVGSEVCRELSGLGARLAFTYWTSEAKARELERCLPGSLALSCDLRDYRAAQAVVGKAAEGLGGLDVLIQCAGTAGDAELYQGSKSKKDKFLDVDEEGFAEMMDLTVRSTFAAAQAASRIMRRAEAGEPPPGRLQGPFGRGRQILIIGSMDGIKTVPAPIHYAAAKGALCAMTQAMAKELGRYGIRVNLIAPGILEGGVGGLLSRELLDDYLQHCALKRLGTAKEVAQVAAWFVARNTYVTAQTVLLDGGL